MIAAILLSALLAGPIEAEVIRVIDGDTFWVRAKVWFDVAAETKVRVRGIDAPEIKGKCAAERERAHQAKNIARRLLSDRVILRDIAQDKYAGRVDAAVTLKTGESFAERMIAAGLARPYDGGKRKGWCASPNRHSHDQATPQRSSGFAQARSGNP